MQTIGKDLAIDLGQDRPGMIAKAFDAIAKANINVDGYCGSSEGTLHVFTTDSAAARKAVEGAGFKVKDERDVVVVDAADRPGTAARLFRQIADAEVNVDLTGSRGRTEELDPPGPVDEVEEDELPQVAASEDAAGQAAQLAALLAFGQRVRFGTHVRDRIAVGESLRGGHGGLTIAHACGPSIGVSPSRTTTKPCRS